jgi:hypothetical protein
MNIVELQSAILLLHFEIKANFSGNLNDSGRLSLSRKIRVSMEFESQAASSEHSSSLLVYAFPAPWKE